MNLVEYYQTLLSLSIFDYKLVKSKVTRIKKSKKKKKKLTQFIRLDVTLDAINFIWAIIRRKDCFSISSF